MERSTCDEGTFAPCRNPGIMAFDWAESQRATWAFGAFTNQTGFDQPPLFQYDHFGYDLSSRVTCLPWYDEPSGGSMILLESALPILRRTQARALEIMRQGYATIYDPKSFVSNRSAAVAQSSQVEPTYGNRASGSDIRPFYGHAESNFGYQSSGENEVGPFYGHAMPGEVLGGWRARRSSTRPYYGHAVSSGDQ